MSSEKVVTPNYGRFNVVPASEITAGACILLYSAAGVGKTSLAGSLADDPKCSPVVVVDAEGGTKVLSDKPGIDVIPISSWKDIEDIKVEFARDTALKWKTIVVDNFSEIMQMCIFAKFGTQQLTQPNWGDVQRAIIDQIRFYRDLAKNRGITTVLIMWDSEEKDAAGRNKLDLNLIPSLQKVVPGLVDYVGHITVLPNGKRQITFASNPQKNVAKFRRNASEVAQQIPLTIDYDLQHMPLVDIISTLRDGVEWPKDKYQATTPQQNTNQRN